MSGADSPAVAAAARPVRLRVPPAAAALALYCLVAFLDFGLRLILTPGSQYLGVFADPQIPIWSFAWWPHAIANGENPFVTHAVWAPVGVNLAWVNAVPVLALLFAPLTLLVGAVVSFNVAALLLPAVSAWGAYLLCHHLTRRFWPSLVGGYLYGFSSYVLGHVLGQPQLSGVFVAPLLALVVYRGIDGSLSRRRVALFTGGLVAVELYLSMEIAFTITVSLLLGLLLGWIVSRAARGAIRSLLPTLVGGYLLAALLAAPVLYYALTAVRIAGFQPPNQFVSDLANLVVPTHLELSGAGWSGATTARFPGNNTEQGSYLGVPLLALIALFAWRSWRTPAARFLLGAAALATYISLGPELTVDGKRLFPLPTPFGHNTFDVPGIGSKFVPLLDNTLPDRFAAYTALAVCVMAALWLAARPAGSVGGWLLAGLAVITLVPNPAAGVWATTYAVPSFFTASVYRSCLAPGEIVLPQPMSGQFTLWQVADDFRFRLAGGRLQTSPPSPFLHPGGTAQISVGYPPVRNQTQLLRDYIARWRIGAIILDKRQAAIWSPSLDRIATPESVGGVDLYRLGAASGACPASP
jgi:hypothetical protein